MLITLRKRRAAEGRCVGERDRGAEWCRVLPCADLVELRDAVDMHVAQRQHLVAQADRPLQLEAVGQRVERTKVGGELHRGMRLRREKEKENKQIQTNERERN